MQKKFLQNLMKNKHSTYINVTREHT